MQTPARYLQNEVKTKRRKGGVKADSMSSFLFAAGERHNSLGVGFKNMIKKEMGPFLKKGPFPVVFVTENPAKMAAKIDFCRG